MDLEKRNRATSLRTAALILSAAAALAAGCAGATSPAAGKSDASPETRYEGSGGLYFGTPSREAIRSGRAYPSTTRLSSITEGVTTKAQVVETLGPPANWRTLDDGSSRFGYDYILPGPAFAKVHSLTIHFDARRVVSELDVPEALRTFRLPPRQVAALTRLLALVYADPGFDAGRRQIVDQMRKDGSAEQAACVERVFTREAVVDQLLPLASTRLSAEDADRLYADLQSPLGRKIMAAAGGAKPDLSDAERRQVADGAASWDRFRSFTGDLAAQQTNVSRAVLAPCL